MKVETKEHIDMETMQENILNNYFQLKQQIPENVTIIAVSKFHSIDKIKTLYDARHRDFGENYVQEIKDKYEHLPKDIRWHFIGHLQTNKVKYIAPFIHLIHSVDSLKLLKEINKEGKKHQRIINCLLQIHIAKEETKFGLSFEEAEELLHSQELSDFQNVKILGLMGMATFTDNIQQIESEFTSIKVFFDKIKQDIRCPILDPKILSIGMTNDYKIAIAHGSNMIRIGTLIFGERNN